MEAGPSLRQGRPQMLGPDRPDLQAAEKPGGLRNTDTIITLAHQQSTLLSCQEIPYPPTKNLAR